MMGIAEKLLNITPLLKGGVEYETSPMFYDAQNNPQVYDLSEALPVDQTLAKVIASLTAAGRVGLNLMNAYNTSRGLRYVDDGVKRKFLNKEQAKKYYQNLIDNAGYNMDNSLDDFYNLPKEELKNIRRQGKFYAKDNYVGKSINIQNYPKSHFSNKNLGKDYIHNLGEYPNLLDDIENSEYHFSSNFYNEPDRLYDHIINDNKLVDYLMEVVKDDKGNISHSYKMMKNLKKGDKP